MRISVQYRGSALPHEVRREELRGDQSSRDTDCECANGRWNMYCPSTRGLETLRCRDSRGVGGQAANLTLHMQQCSITVDHAPDDDRPAACHLQTHALTRSYSQHRRHRACTALSSLHGTLCMPCHCGLLRTLRVATSMQHEAIRGWQPSSTALSLCTSVRKHLQPSSQGSRSAAPPVYWWTRLTRHD